MCGSLNGVCSVRPLRLAPWTVCSTTGELRCHTKTVTNAKGVATCERNFRVRVRAGWIITSRIPRIPIMGVLVLVHYNTTGGRKDTIALCADTMTATSDDPHCLSLRRCSSSRQELPRTGTAPRGPSRLRLGMHLLGMAEGRLRVL